LVVLGSAGVAAGSSFVPIAGALASAVLDAITLASFHKHAVVVYGLANLNERVDTKVCYSFSVTICNFSFPSFSLSLLSSSNIISY
jgi:hypothetical protein